MTLTPPSSSFSLGQWWKRQRKSILLPMLGIGGFLLFWQLSSSLGLTKLTGPLSLWTDERTRELLLYPFFDRGGLDKGLFHHSMSSLARVAIGYTRGPCGHWGGHCRGPQQIP
jgi:bicarbonate transport system permease protein